MLPNTKTIIEAALGSDATISRERKDEIQSVLNPQASSQKRILITTKKASEILEVSVVTLRKYEKRGLLTPIRYTARRIRWDRKDVETFKMQGVQAFPA